MSKTLNDYAKEIHDIIKDDTDPDVAAVLETLSKLDEPKTLLDQQYTQLLVDMAVRNYLEKSDD